ncbi:MAG: DNA polymerase I [Bacteroidaceae bacterium]|nr:DNA polymerase I [Bacteroidaceae bacterium]
MQKLYLLDAYALIYRAYYAFIKNPRINSRGENTSAVLGFVNTLDEVLQKEQPTHLGVAFDPSGGTFRHEAYPEYKAQREETPEAIRFAVPYIKRLLEAYRIPILEVPGFEADDVIGTLAHEADQRGIDTFMMTPDKDYGQLVTERVRMYRPPVGKNEAEILGPEEVNRKWGLQRPTQVIDMLGLMGDAVDNIPGCPGVGEKTAAKLIQEFGSIEALLENTDKLKGALKTKVEENIDKIRQSKWLATIRTDVPIALDMNQLAVQEPDEEALRTLFEELEFRTLMRRKQIERTAPTKPQPQAIQGDLFAGFAEAGENTTASRSQYDSKQEPPRQQAGAPATASGLQTLRHLPHDYQLVDTPEARKKLIAKLSEAKEICLDTETTGTDPLQAELVGLSFAIREGEAWYVPCRTQEVVDEFRTIYEDMETLKVGQNLKYDLQVLANYGIELRGPMFDTMIAHYLLHPEMRHGMDYLAEAYLHYQTIHIEELIGRGKQQRSMADLPPADICDYASEDADITLRLYHLFAPQLREEGCEALFRDIEMPLMPVLAQMERNGVRVDTDALGETSRLFTSEMQRLEEEIYQLAGMHFNIASPKQVGEILFDRLHISSKAKKTKTGQYVTSEEVLESLRPNHPIVDKILEHRGLKKLLGTYIDALPQLINPQTGHIHTSFNQTIAATGRLSSSNPNLQNIPVRDAQGKEVRKAFIPDEGQLFFSADYSQIELRIMAHLSEDPNLIDAFRQGHDIHAATAAKIFKKDIAEVSGDERRKAKTANFGIIYGISAFGLAERMGVSRQEAKQLIDGYFATYPSVKAYMDRSIAMARDRGYTETIFGRRCHLPDINSHNAVVRGYAERNAINAPIQGSAADIIKIAMIRIHQRMREEGFRSKMILQVHDELNFSVLPEEKVRLEALVLEEMQTACRLRVPLIADCGWGNNWLEAH